MSNQFAEIVFGAGRAILTPAATNGPALPTPLQIPIMQELSIDISGDKAELYGQDFYSYAVARTKTKISCKAKMGAVYAQFLSDLFNGSTTTTGQTLGVTETQAVSANNATVTHNGANYYKDLGVVNATTGSVYTFNNAGAGANGQYANNNGVYSFHAVDGITSAVITYAYNNASIGKSASIVNNPMGSQPQFDFVYFNSQWGTNMFLEFYKCVATKIGIPNKNTDFEMIDFEFDCFSNSSGQVYNLSLDQ